MKMKNIIVVLSVCFIYLAFFILGCNNVNSHKNTIIRKTDSENKNFYKDFDFTSLEGLEQSFHPLKLPFVEKQTTENRIKIKVYGLDDYYLERTFVKVKYGWHGVYNYENPKEDIHTYYINPEKVQEISYQINSEGEKFVHRLSFFSKDSIENFIFSRKENLFFEFDEKGNYPLKKARFRDITKFEKKANYIEVAATRKELETDRILSHEVTCYNSHEFSIFWWYHTGLLFEKISC